VFLHFFIVGHFGRTLENAALRVWANTSGNNQANAAAGPLSVEFSQAFEAVFRLFQPCVHRPHQRAVTQPGKSKIKWLKQMRVPGHSWSCIGGHNGSPHRNFSQGFNRPALINND